MDGNWESRRPLGLVILSLASLCWFKVKAANRQPKELGVA